MVLHVQVWVNAGLPHAQIILLPVVKVNFDLYCPAEVQIGHNQAHSFLHTLSHMFTELRYFWEPTGRLSNIEMGSVMKPANLDID